MHILTTSQYSALQAFRKELHANPGVSGEEHKTAERVLAFLASCSPNAVVSGLGGTGIVATFDSGKPGPCLLFRAELDALPIQEVNSFAYASKVHGVSHKCGHDGHTTILLGLAQQLHEKRPEKGSVLLLFQPAEEDGRGAKAMLADPHFAHFKPDFVFAFHNLPGYPLHQVVYREGSFSAAVTSVIFHFFGKTAHAAEPEHGLNPALSIAHILQGCGKLSNNQPERDDFTLITPVQMEMGEIAYGISAGYGELRLTLRCWSQENMEKLSEEVLRLAEDASAKYGLYITHEWTHSFNAIENNPEAVGAVYGAAEQLGLSIHKRAYPFKWGEDFGLFTQHFPGAMFGIGSGETCPALHNPDYDFPDELLDTGVALFHQLCKDILS
ncbi:MAG TPA: amidohydrolase [Bacteroidetes bacterium]|nr:amidohydrolase [Bacteroidota bacterium]